MDSHPCPLDPKTIARRADPDTSRQAAQAITASGKRLTQNDLIAAYLKDHHGATVWDIGQAIGLNYLRMAERMGDVAGLGYEPRGKCWVEDTDSHMQMWWPVEPASPAEPAARKQTSLF